MMKNLVFTLFAIALAGLAAIAATTAMLNTPVRSTPAALAIGPPASEKKPDAPATPAPTGDAPAPPSDAGKPAPGGAGQPSSDPAAGGAKPAEAPQEPEEDKDPYEGIAPEDLPPDLQYDADSSVSFPTNT
jgi:hypothetical protein